MLGLHIKEGGHPPFLTEVRITLFRQNMCSRILGPIDSCTPPSGNFNVTKIGEGGI